MKQLAVIVAIVGMSAVAHADEWSNTQEFAGAQQASIKVVEPEGYTVTINGRTDTVPAVFAVDNANNYLNMTIKSPDGATWSKKIEVKEYKQSVVKVRHVKAAAPDKPADNKPKAMSYVGNVKNTSNNCSTGATAIKVDFLAGPDVAKSQVLEAGQHANLELAVGTYKIRLYTSDGTSWNFKETVDWPVSKDGWEYSYGCDAKRRR
jgi:hypothetical protein